jgi:hypothetical protein
MLSKNKVNTRVSRDSTKSQRRARDGTIDSRLATRKRRIYKQSGTSYSLDNTKRKTDINETRKAVSQSNQDVEKDELTNTIIEIDSSHVPKSQLINKLRKLRPKMWSDDE